MQVLAFRHRSLSDAEPGSEAAPSEAAALEASEAEPLVVSIKADGSLFINLERDKDKALPIEDIQKKVTAVLNRKPETPVLVWGDRNVPYGKVVGLMAKLQASGAPSVGLVTDPNAAEML